MPNTLQVTDANHVIEVLDDHDLDAVSGGLLLGNFGQFSLISANNQGFSFVNIGSFALLRIGQINVD
jgi:hypothetical protein